MSSAFPKFVPILTAYATRVSGRSMAELISSSAALARALADTQRVVGHDGVLCLYDPARLSASCLISDNSFCQPDEFPKSGSVSVLLDAVKSLQRQLPSHVKTIACFPGPALIFAELKRLCDSDPTELADYDYVGDAFLAVVKAAFETGVSGIAIVEDGTAWGSSDVASFYRSARKLADFYSHFLFGFVKGPSARGEAIDSTHCNFLLPASKNDPSLVYGSNGLGIATTSCDVRPDFPVESLVEMRIRAMQELEIGRIER